MSKGPPTLRLDRLLANLGYGSRREVQRLVVMGLVTLDGEPLTLAQVSVNPTALGLRTLPYRMPAPWSAVFIYRLDARTLRSLESAHNLTIGAQYARSGTLTFAGDWDGSGAIAAFRRGIGLAD